MSSSLPKPTSENLFQLAKSLLIRCDDGVTSDFYPSDGKMRQEDRECRIAASVSVIEMSARIHESELQAEIYRMALQLKHVQGASGGGDPGALAN